MLRIMHQAQQQTRIQSERYKNAEESCFFSQRRQNKIRIPDGNKTALVLAAASQSLAPESACANRNLRLQDLVAGLLGIVFRPEERLYTFLLVRLQNVMPSDRNQNRGQNQKCDRMLPLYPGEVRSYNCHGNKHQGGAQVRLLQNHQERHARQDSYLDEVAQGELVGSHFTVKACQHNNDDQLEQLRHLEGLSHKVNPPLRAKAG